MIRRDGIGVVLLMLGVMSAPAVAGTLYRCVGRADQTINYSSTRVPEMACKAISYVGGSTHARSPVAYGHGPGNGQADASATTAPAPAETGLAGSIAIPTAAGAPVIAKIATAPPRGGIGGFGNAPQVVFRTSEGSESPAAPVIPKGVRARVTRGAMYKYTRDGISTYTNIPPPGSTGAKILFTYVETCFACGALPGVNFGTMVLNTQAYASEIAAAAHAYGVDAALVRAIIHAESDYNPNAVSYKGAQGLMQLMPGTASRFGVHNAFAAADNINGGVQYLSFLSRHFNGNVKLIAAAYNAGEGAVDRYGGVPPYTETQRYVERVGTLAERYRSAK